MPHVKEVLQSIFGKDLPKGWYQDKHREIEQSRHVYELYAVKFTLIHFKCDVFLKESERDKVIMLYHYCNMRIDLLEASQVKRFQKQLA